MNKFQKIITLLGAGTLVLIAILFYWTQYRPSQIKHECSWVKEHSDAIPARTGMSTEEMQAKGLLKNCPPTPTLAPGQGYLSLFTELDYNRCYIDNQNNISKNKPQKYVPAKNWYVRATKVQYEFCLHDKGL